MGDAMGLECSRFDDNVVLKQPKLAAVCTSSQRSTWATPSDEMLDKCLIDVQTNVRVPIRRTTKRSSTMREKASHSSTASEHDDISSLRSLTSSGGYRGVQRLGRTFCAQLILEESCSDQACVFLGRFSSAEDAVGAVL